MSDKKVSKNLEKVLKKSVAFSQDSYKIIEDEMKLSEDSTGYRPSRSAIIERALKLLQSHRSSINQHKVSAEHSGKSKIKKARGKE